MSPRLDRRRARTPMALVVAVLSLVAGLLTVAPAAPAQAAELPSSILEGGFIISDAEFFASGSMTAAQIQTFLNARVTTCRATTGPDCLKSFTTDLAAQPADKYCKAVAARANATAAQVISAVATACGINPKVILVMLQKEQGLVTSTAPSEWNYRAAMGQACPDTAPCSEAAAGFVNQVYKGARQLQVYTLNPNSFNYRAGQVNTIKWHPSSACGSSKVFIQNQATANLYIYTPYRANVAALAAGTATGDACSAYGNRNFYNFYVSWFAPGASSSTGAPAQVAACTVPASADIAAASGSAKLKAAATGRKAPTNVCTSGTTALAKDAIVSVTGAYGAWMRVTSGSTTMWVLKTALDVTTTGSPAAGGSVCTPPAESSVTKASGTAVVATGTLNARKAPSTDCETGKTQITMGAKYARDATYGVWWRLSIGGTKYWVHSGYVALEATSTPAPAPSPSPSPTPTEEAKPATKTMYLNASIHLRGSASSTGKVLSTLVGGTKVTVTGTTGAWSSVTIGSTKGWVDTKRLVAKAPAAFKTSAMQTKSAISMRVAINTSSSVVQKLAKGTKVTVVGTAGSWRAVKVGSKTGWVLLSQLTKVTAATTAQTTTSLNLRASASTSSKILTVLKKGTKVTITSTSGVWRKVTVSGRTGWVHSSYLKTVSSSTSSATTTVPGASSNTMTTTTALNLRASSTTSSKILTVLAKGTKVTITSSTGVWRKVTVSGRTGWVHSGYLK